MIRKKESKMKKKIIFVGPPNAGKTTLRKIFFEGENRSKLLEFALEPTKGVESMILKLKGEVGIFDLAGQENYKWFGTKKKTLFYETNMFIVVIDAAASMEEIADFTKKVINIRNDLTPSAFIYLLIHKIDLLERDILYELKLQIKKEIAKTYSIKYAFTSIQRRFFLETFSTFIDILKVSTSELTEFEEDDFKFLKNTIDLLFQIQNDVVISKTDLIKKLNISNKAIENIIKILENKNHIKISKKAQDIPVFSLTDKGKEYFDTILKNFSLEKFEIDTNDIEMISERVGEPPFLGFLISDNHGRTLISTEVYDGVFDKFLRKDNEETFTDFELIPMFISALESFSKVLNIKDLSGFKLKGTNIKMQTIRYQLLTITLFMRRDTNIKAVMDQIKKWFDNIFEKYENDFETSINTGQISHLNHLTVKGKKWLDKLNQEYKKISISTEIIDLKHVTDLHEKLDEISSNLDLKHSIQIQKLKELKSNLLIAASEENFQEIKEIAKKIKYIHESSL